MRLTIALGGNAILQPGQKGTAEEQFANVIATCEQIGKLVEEGHEIVITHGNGPQVGSILIQQEMASSEVPKMSLDICGAESQGLIGYMIQNSMHNILAEKNIEKNVATVVTQVLVDVNDPAFKNPTKPVGPFYNQEHAEKMMKEKGETWIEDSGRGWRKVVPSPVPTRIVEAPLINDLVEKGNLVIASGGGGIPVIEKDGKLVGVEAVIDKDRAGRILAEETNSDMFLILTDVSNAAINYGTPEQKNLGEVSIEEMEKYIEEGHFGAGSMKPKVESVVTFAKNNGKPAIITSLDKVLEAVHGTAGTRIKP